MNKLRTWHSYIGVFTAPTILFFALSGSFQLFNLHEKHGQYRPPTLVQKLAQIHKDQMFAHADDDDPAPSGSIAKAVAPPVAQPAHGEDDKPTMVAFALKAFFLVVSISLIGSTLMGLWIGLSNARRKLLSWILFVLGMLVPLALVTMV